MPLIKKLRAAATGALTLCLCSQVLLAQGGQEKPPTLEGDPLTKTATRTERPLHDQPQQTVLVDPERLLNAKMLQDALREIPGVHVQRTSQGQSSPTMRGLTGYHTLLLLDGVRINNSIIRSGPNEYWGLVDGLSLGGAEVVTGPGSVLYGSDAVGGTLNASTRRRKDYDEDFGFNTRTFFRASSAEQSLIGRMEVSGNVGQELGFLIGGTYNDYGAVKRGEDGGAQLDTGFDAHHLDAAIDYFLDENWSFALTVRRSKLDAVPRTHRQVNAPLFRGTVAGTELQRDSTFERDLAIFGLKGEDLDTWVDELDIKLVWIGLDEEVDRIRGDGRRDVRGFDLDTFGIAVQASTDLPHGTLVYGFDWYRDSVDSHRRDYDATGALTSIGIQGPVGDDSTYDLAGLFAQYSLPVGEQFEFWAGGRLTYASLESNRVQDPVSGNAIALEDDWFDGSVSVRGLWKPDESLRFWAGISQAFRAPNLSDVTRLDSARSNEVEIASPGLDPEDFLTFEIGTHVRWEGFTVDLGYFYTIVDGMIIRQPTGAMIGSDLAVAKRNAGDGSIQGIELKAAYAFDDSWSTFGTFHWTDGQVDSFPTSSPASRKEPLSKMMPMAGTLGVRYDAPDRALFARAWIEGAFEQDRLSTADRRDTQRIPPGGTPGWVTVNAEVGFDVTDHASAIIALENIGDEDYRRHGSGLQEPGFNVIAALELSF